MKLCQNLRGYIPTWEWNDSNSYAHLTAFDTARYCLIVAMPVPALPGTTRGVPLSHISASNLLAKIRKLGSLLDVKL